MGVRIGGRGDRRHIFPDFETGGRFIRNRRNVCRRRQRTQFAGISRTQASGALRLRHSGEHAHYKSKNDLDHRSKNSGQHGVQFHHLCSTIISSENGMIAVRCTAAGAILQQFHDILGRTAQHCLVATYDDRPLDQIRILHHDPDQFLVG